MLMLSHISGHIIHLFSTSSFLFLNFYSPYSIKKNYIKRKTLLLPIGPHLLLQFLQPFPSLFTFLSPHYSLLTVTLPSLFSLSYILNILLPHFILYKFNIISLIQSIFFIQKNCKFSLSLSLSRVDFCSFLLL